MTGRKDQEVNFGQDMFGMSIRQPFGDVERAV